MEEELQRLAYVLSAVEAKKDIKQVNEVVSNTILVPQTRMMDIHSSLARIEKFGILSDLNVLITYDWSSDQLVEVNTYTTGVASYDVEHLQTNIMRESDITFREFKTYALIRFFPSIGDFQIGWQRGLTIDGCMKRSSAMIYYAQLDDGEFIYKSLHDHSY